uniref:Switch-associated protein 70 n=1 Tax=Sinocyclocheilus grahami TaxID=75366 RepID=A0A672KVX2_SINGR
MLSRDEILKPIWYGFTALDVDRNGKVSKSQLKVLSHNLCTILKISHNTSALEEHFKDDDEGPVSTQGYMPYLNMFILDKLEYFLRRLFAAMGCSWNEDRFEGYKMQLGAKKKHLNAWELIELIGMGHFIKGINPQTLSMGINEVYQELVMDVVKQGYMMKKGHKRKNWTERWFELHLNYMSYYVSEDLIEQKGCISLDRNCCVESLPDKDGKKNLFIIKCVEKSFEINASDKKAKQEWIQAIQDCIVHIRQGLSSPHRESRQKRRELRNKMKAEQEMMENRMRQLQLANESKQAQLEAMTKNLQEASMRGDLEEQRRFLTQKELLDQYRRDLEQEKMARMQMEEQVVEKANEVEQNWQRMQELEDMYRQLKKALDDERQAKEDEEALRKLQARLLQEEANKRLELEQIHQQQQEILSQSQKEKEELERERAEKESALQAAQEQLQSLRRQREGAQEEYMVVTKKLERAANKTKNWKHKVSKHEGLLQIIQPGTKSPTKMTNWGQAAFSETELDEMERIWQENKNRSYDGQ